MKLGLWKRALRPFSFFSSFLPVCLGGVLAAKRGQFDLRLFLLSLVGVLFIHGGTNLLNNYYDYRCGVDTEESLGYDNLLLYDLLAPKKVKKVGWSCFLATLPIIIYLVYRRGLPVLVLTLLGVIGGSFYTAPPLNYKYYALGVPLVFTLLGPLVVIGSYYVQTARFSLRVVLVSLPVGFLVSAILHGNDFRDIEYDRQVGIKTLAIVLGKQSAAYLYSLLVFLPYFVVSGLAFFNLATVRILITLVTIPRAVKNSFRVQKAAVDPNFDIEDIDRKTVYLYINFVGLLVVAAFFG